MTWRAKLRAEAARRFARAEARALVAAVQLQLNQPLTAAEILWALAKQGIGGFSNFQRVGTELLAAHPGLASLQLEPGGVVSDTLPRVGNERTLGINVLKDAGQRVAANEAMARRILTVAGPVMLDHGALGIVAREPVFQRTPDGRDSFWGFVAVSMRLPEALSRAHMDDLVRQGYNLAFYAPASGQQKAVGIASHGLKSLRDSVQEPVRVQNLEFRLALRPQGGWIDYGKVAFESLAVLLLSALIALSLDLLASRRAVEVEAQATTQRLIREAADRTKAQADYRGAKQKLETTQAEQQQSQLALQKLESELARLQAKLAGDIAARDEAGRAHQAELQEAHDSLRRAQETIAQLRARLETAAQAKDAASAARERLKPDQSRIAELQLRLEAALRTGRQIAEASAARQAELEQSNRELRARLAVAERAEARVTKLDELLKKAQEELGHRQEASTAVNAVVAAAAEKIQDDKPDVIPSEPRKSGSTDPSGTASAPPPRKHEAGSRPAPRPAKAFVEAVSPAGPPITRDALKTQQRKKASRDDQLSLFGNEGSPVPAAKPPASEDAEVQAGSGTTRPNLPVESPKEQEPAPSRHLPAPPPVDPTQLRKAVNQIVPLLTERDPGAKDCLRDNRKTFRSAFAPEAYVEFEELVKDGDSDTALEHLKKAVRKHGICA